MKPRFSDSASAHGSSLIRAARQIMNRVGTRSPVVLSAIAFALFLVGVPANAQSVPQIEPVSIAVIDFKRVLHQSKAAEAVRAQIDAQRKAYQQEFDDLERTMRQEEQKLQQQRAILAQDAFQARAKDFQDRVASAQRDVQVKRRALNAAFDQAMNEISKVLISIVADLAKEANVGAILDNNNIVLADKKLDISDIALARLDAKQPKVTIELTEKKR